MTGGLRVAANAMSSLTHRHDVIANNLANVSTPGFARQDTFVAKLQTVEAAPFETPQVLTRTDFRQGPPVITGNPLDLSLDGAGFFTLRTEEGAAYSRYASLRVSADGILQTPEGLPVLGENGVLFVGEGDVSVEKDGAVFVDGQLMDRLKIARFETGDDIVRNGQGTYLAREDRLPDPNLARPDVLIGQIEGSSVVPVNELVAMIQATRAYEAAASAARASDTTLERAVNDIARV